MKIFPILFCRLDKNQLTWHWKKRHYPPAIRPLLTKKDIFLLTYLHMNYEPHFLFLDFCKGNVFFCLQKILHSKNTISFSLAYFLDTNTHTSTPLFCIKKLYTSNTEYFVTYLCKQKESSENLFYAPPKTSKIG